MTLLEASVTIMSGILALLGGGAAVRWIDARRTITVRALDMVDHGREDTSAHVTSMVDCERRCGRLEGELAGARVEVERLQQRITGLEADVATMRRLIDGLLEQLAESDRARRSEVLPARVVEVMPARSRLGGER